MNVLVGSDLVVVGGGGIPAATSLMRRLVDAGDVRGVFARGPRLTESCKHLAAGGSSDVPEEPLAAAWRLMVDFRTPDQPVADAAFEDWSDLVEAESRLAGVVSTMIAGGGVDRAALAGVRSTVGRASPYEAAWQAHLRTVLSFVDEAAHGDHSDGSG